MMWQVTPLNPNQSGKFCGFTPDDTSLLVSMEDGRFFEIGFNDMGEMQGQDILTGQLLEIDTENGEDSNEEAPS